MGILDRFRTRPHAGFFGKAIVKHTQQLQGQVEQNKIRFGSDIGEEHPFDYSTTEGLYKKVSIVSGAIDKIVDFVWGPGFFIKSPDKKSKNKIDAWMEQVDFGRHGRQWLREALIKGTGYLELGGNITEPPQGVKVLTANNMFIRRNAKGKFMGYTQAMGSARTSVRTQKQLFKPHQIASLALNVVGDSPYGLGKVWPNVISINNFLKNQKDMHTLISKKANVPTIVYMGNRDTGELPTEGDVTDLANKLQTLDNSNEWVFGDNVRVEALSYGKIGENFTDVLKNNLLMLIIGFQVPEVLLGTGNIPEGLAKVQMDAFERMIKSIQVEIEDQIENKILPRIVGPDVLVEYQWGQPSSRERTQEIDVIQQALKNPLLSDHARTLLEGQLLSLLGFEPQNAS